MFTGKHLIGGEWVAGSATMVSSTTDGEGHVFAVASADDAAAAAVSAEAAFASYSQTTRQQRTEFLTTIAEEIDARGEAITTTGCLETALPEMRLNGERGRTTGQLRLFADHILAGDYLDRRHDPALPDRQPLPRPDLRLMQRPLGPVAVFGASNFPLAFSVAGGDTASALAAGCPVVVKGHPAHPGTGELVADAVNTAREKCGLHPGVFSFIQAGGNAAGAALVTHPRIKAVGFTGSLAGGRALFDLCAQRSEPIPFFGELGSVNPMFLLPNAMAERAAELGTGWAASLTMGVGQFCTNPGVAVVLDGADADTYIDAAVRALAEQGEQTLLTESIAQAYCAGNEQFVSYSGVEQRVVASCSERRVSPALFETTFDTWVNNPAIAEEVFGPLGVVVRVSSIEQMLSLASELAGQLTCTLHLNDEDGEIAGELLPVLERKAGRILANAFPTGVEVCDAMVHGGPYPASTNFGATSVGTMAIRRFLRPVCYQGIPEQLLPLDLQS